MTAKHNQKVVVIGGTGFIGSSLTKSLSTKKNIKLSMIHQNPFLGNKPSNVEYHQINVSKLSKKLIDVISNTDCLLILSQPNKQLVENITKFGFGIKKIIYASTLLLYPNSPKKQNEDSPLKPVNNYEKNKLIEEQILSYYAKTSNIKLCIVRLSNIYGNVKNRGIIQKIFSAILNNEQITINGNGNQLRDYTFIDDAINVLVYLIFSNQDKLIDIFNICSGEGHTLNEAILMVEEITGKKLFRAKGKKTKEKSSVIGDNTKIIKSTGIKPQHNFKQGLIKTYQNNVKYRKI